MRMYPSSHKNKKVAAVVAVLEDWFVAMENGSAQYRLPDPFYISERPWDSERINALIDVIDDYLESQIFGNKHIDGTRPGNGWAGINSTNVNSPKATASSDFSRLDLDQRLALAQQLEEALKTPDLFMAELDQVIDIGNLNYD